MDVKMALMELGLDLTKNVFTVTKSDYPNELVEWSGPDARPTQSELDAAWVSFQSKNPNFGNTDELDSL